MKVIALVAAFLTVVIPTALGFTAFTASVTYDETYDDGSESLDIVTCSTGVNGLAQFYSNFSEIPSFPFIGGAAAISGFDSPNCGTCWNLSYTPTHKFIFITAIDSAQPGFNIALKAMNNLTNNLAEELGRINVTALQVDVASCGLSDPI